MQKQMTPGGPWGQAQAEDQIKVKTPDVEHDIHASMRLGGATDVSEEAQREAAEAAEQRGRKTRLLCCCRGPGCPIGPFTEVEEY